MSEFVFQYKPAPRGYASDFARSEQPSDFAARFVNRFISLEGAAEKRQGMEQIGSGIPTGFSITGLHEYIAPRTNVSTLFASSQGRRFRYDPDADTWSQVLSGKDPAQRLISVQMDDKLIFVNGSDRNFFTDDAGDSFQELQPLISKGEAGAGSDEDTLTDPLITDWINSTDVRVNDINYNVTRDAYGIITAVASASVAHTEIGPGATGLGVSTSAQQPGDNYEIYDLVALNIIDTPVGLDNIALGDVGTSANTVVVSGSDFLNSEARIGDFIRNTTRQAVMEIEAIATSTFTVTSVADQTDGDSFVFLKKSMPIATWPHVHYGRLYLIDERDQTKIRVSGPEDPQDFTTTTGTLDATSLSYGSTQPQPETLLSIGTFQKNLVVQGRSNIYVSDGITPIEDDNNVVKDIQPLGLFTQGGITRFGLANTGNDMVYIGKDGVRSFNIDVDARSVSDGNLAEPIKTEISQDIELFVSAADTMSATYYPRRNWALVHIGSKIYNFNFTPLYMNGQYIYAPSISKFVGKFAEQEVYFVRNNGDLICAGEVGRVYKFDGGNYDDDGDNIRTTFTTPWLTMVGGKTVDTQQGNWIRPVFETGEDITYTIQAISGLKRDLSNMTVSAATSANVVIPDQIVGTYVIGSQAVSDAKLPLRWRGRQVQLNFETDDANGPDKLARFTLYGCVIGRE